MYILAIDQGTSGTKAIVVDGGGPSWRSPRRPYARAIWKAAASNRTRAPCSTPS
ncbi:hypothetical protein [Nonomuraea sp. NPDC049028]|uniref:hypothetical protein n=1 Tax=Nonomuraea sp. NPDC049028 TaxID=3364348 RepID=UPI0037194103